MFEGIVENIKSLTLHEQWQILCHIERAIKQPSVQNNVLIGALYSYFDREHLLWDGILIHSVYKNQVVGVRQSDHKKIKTPVISLNGIVHTEDYREELSFISLKV